MELKQFYKVDYIPNKIAYVTKVTSKEIHFLAFFKGQRGI